MRLPSVRNRWVTHLGCVALGAVLCAGAWVGVDIYQDADLSDRLQGRWTLHATDAGPPKHQVDVEYRPDGTFMVWRTANDGTSQIVEHGRWWVSGRQLLQEYDSLEGRPVPAGAQPRPESKMVVRADVTLILVWPAGHQYQFRRPTA